MAIALVNHVEVQDLTGSSFTTLATAAFVATAGNLIVIGLGQDTNTTRPSSITDTAGNTYTRVVGADATPGSLDLITLWYAFNITGNASNVVTAHWAGNHEYGSMNVMQFSGVLTTDPIDVGTSAIATSPATSITSGSFTTTQADEVICVFARNHDGGTFSVGLIGGTNATSCFNTGGAGAAGQGGEYLIVSGIQTGITAKMNGSPSSSDWEMSIASFKAAGGGATGGGPLTHGGSLSKGALIRGGRIAA